MKNDNTQNEILTAYKRFQQAMIDKDMGTLYAMVAPDKTFIHMSGKKQTKEQFFGEIQNGTLNYYKSVVKEPVVVAAGNHANLKAKTTLTARVYGMSGTWTLPTDQNFCRIDDEWKLCD